MSASRASTLVIVAALCGCATESVPSPSESVEDDAPLWKQYFEQHVERIRSGEVTPVLHIQQARSVEYALFAPPVIGDACTQAVAVSLPGKEEVAHFLAQRERFPSEGFEYLDEFFLDRDDLKALAVRDSDSDGIADYLVSDYFGKFMEGDIDIDGDGTRNTLDPCPYDAEHGGSSGVDQDANGNGVPDHVDLAFRHESGELSEIQSSLFRDHEILLVERNAAFDVPLARAVDDTVRRVFRAYFEQSPVMPTLRTLAVEHTALIGPLAKAYVDDHTSAQTFSHTQSLTVYDEGRAVEHDIGLLGLIVHEMGHSYHMALDFDAGDLAAENTRTDFPAPNFVAVIEPFGWVPTGYYDGRFDDSARASCFALPPASLQSSTDVAPRFAYVGGAEPVFEYRGRSPETWGEWLLEQYDALGQDPEYLKDRVFADQQVVGDYALTSPYEWFGDHFIAYVITVLERHTVDKLEASGRADAVEPALAAIEDAMRGIWPDFYHRNIAPEVLAYFEQTFPITMDDRQILTRRYIDPIIEPELGL